MREEAFEELLANARLAGAWLRGEHVEGIHVTFVGEPDPRKVRGVLGMTHEEFASGLCVSVDELHRWEQGRGDPHPASARLLRIADKHPAVFRELASQQQPV